MTKADYRRERQQNKLRDVLHDAIWGHAHKTDMTFAESIGILEIVKRDLLDELFRRGENPSSRPKGWRVK